MGNESRFMRTEEDDATFRFTRSRTSQARPPAFGGCVSPHAHPPLTQGSGSYWAVNGC